MNFLLAANVLVVCGLSARQQDKLTPKEVFAASTCGTLMFTRIIPWSAYNRIATGFMVAGLTVPAVPLMVFAYKNHKFG